MRYDVSFSELHQTIDTRAEIAYDRILFIHATASNFHRARAIIKIADEARKLHIKLSDVERNLSKALDTIDSIESDLMNM